jgi:hypothetical protein
MLPCPEGLGHLRVLILKAPTQKKSVMGIPEQNGGFNWFYDVQWESQLHMMGFHGFSGHI